MQNILEGELSESEYETSSDDYIPTSESESEDEVDATPKKRRKFVKNRKLRNKSTSKTGDSSDNEDLPLSTIRRQLTSDPDSDDDVPIANLQKRYKAAEESKAAEEDELLSQLLDISFWENEEFFPPHSIFKGTLEEPPRDGLVRNPIDYFKAMISDTMMEKLAFETNRYSIQKEGISINTTSREISILIGLYLRMGLVVAHSVQSYWAAETLYPMVADLMSRNRFQKLLSSLHMIDNTSVADDDKRDKLWKIRPWLEDLKANFKDIPQEEHSAVDEIMIPFKGKSSVKQYMRNKPHKWGFKMWGRAGASGMLYEFEVYQGAAAKVKERSALGMTGEVVMRMTSTVPEGLNYKVFADNLFTSLELVKQLNQKGILYVGTVRMNRLKGCALKDEKSLKKEGRGSIDSQVELNTGVIALRWYDTRTVDLVSSYVGKDPLREVKRFDRKEKKNILVPCPKIVQEYNTYMGGIDLLDSLTSLYKPGVKTRRWYMYIWLHTLHISLVNAWLHYRMHCKLLGVAKHMKLSTFQGRVAGSLVSTKQAVGRPRATDFSPPPSRTARRGLLTAEVRLDQVSHLPEWSIKRGRCKNQDCRSLTFVMCSKCQHYACFTKERNCFAQFHLCK